jgi:PAS domain S-box-containing protein
MKNVGQIQNNRILVIDDNPSIHDDLRSILCGNRTKNHAMEAAEAALFDQQPEEIELPAFEIDSAFQGREGLERVNRSAEAGRPYAMAFVDVRMPPGWDGIETITQIWRAHPGLQVVICTAYSDYSWEGIIKNLGESNNLVILKKPFDNIEALQLAHALTRKWCLCQESKTRLEDLDKMVSLRTQELLAAKQKLEREAAELSRAQEALIRSEERFSKAFRSNPLPMAVYLFETERCIDANDQFLRMLGCQAADIIDRPLPQSHLIADPQQWAMVRDVLRKSEPVRNAECQFRSSSGTLLNTLLWAEPMNVAAESCVLIIIEDVTERRNLEKQLQQAQKMEAVGQLASGIAHDFNNILTVIQGHVELVLMTGNAGEMATKSLKQVSLASSRAASLTRQLLTFSRKQSVQPKILHLKNQIESLREMLGRLIGEHIQLESECSADLPCILADPCSIEQIIMNLAVNARDAMPEGGMLTIQTANVELDEAYATTHLAVTPGAYVVLTASDTGTGMSPEVQARLFEPFFTTKEPGKGTGLGLATVYGIVKQSSGYIWADSEAGHGAAFRVYLPRANRISVESAPSIEVETPPRGEELVLLVEDEAGVRRLARRFLENAGYRVLDAVSGTDAETIFAEHRDEIDLLVSDVVMPGMTGPELFHRLAAGHPGLKVVYMSGYANEVMARQLNLNGGEPHLQKPFTASQLVSYVRAVLDGRAVRHKRPTEPSR